MKRFNLFFLFLLMSFFSIAQTLNSLYNSKWKGYYVCSQGKTNLELEIINDNNKLTAFFEFNSTNTIKGKYSLIGLYNENQKKLTFEPLKWIQKPNDYSMVGLSGSLYNNGTVFKGKIQNSNCQEFYLERIQFLEQFEDNTVQIDESVFQSKSSAQTTKDFVRLEDIKPTKSTLTVPGYSFQLTADKTIEKRILQINKCQFSHGLGAHADADLRWNLNKEYDLFTGMVGHDDESSCGDGMIFYIYAVYDDKRGKIKLFSSKVHKIFTPAEKFSVNLRDAVELHIYIDKLSAMNCDHANIVDPILYKKMDLPVITWITPGSSSVETTDLPYTIKASIQSEKQVRIIKVMSGDSMVASANSFSLINGQNTFEKNIELFPGSNELSIIAENEYGQAISTKRTVKYNEPQSPPLLLLSDIVFTDHNGNNRIDGNEECYIKFSISNKGKGPAHNLKVLLRNNSDIKGLSFNSLTTLGSISQNAQQNVIIPISGIMDLTTGILNLHISFEEQRGFPPDPVDMQIETKAFVKPDIRIVDYSFLTDNGSIKLGYPIQLKVLVQNVGQGIGDNVSVKFQYPGQNVYLNGPKDFLIGTMQPGATKELVFEFIPNKLYSETNIPITVKISEKYGKFSQERMVSAVVAAKSAGNTIAVKSNTSDNILNIEVASLSADVDKNIPQNAVKHPFRYALIIGNEDYSSRQRTLGSEVNVAFAVNDAKTFKEYAINTFGVEEQNCMLLTNATAGEISQKIELISQILSRLSENGELIFYYAGHGFPDENTKISYLIPVDVSTTNLQSAIKLSDLYQKLSQTKAKQITIFLDACFTGGGRDQGLLAARGVRIKPLNDNITGNMVVFAATSDDQSALPYTEKQHGFFTYYLLKKLQETKGDVSYEELSKYLKTNVSLESLRINNKPQDPSLQVSADVQNTWSQWKIK